MPGNVPSKRCFKNFTKFTGKHLCWSLFYNKVTGMRFGILLKKRLNIMCFLVDFVNFLRAPPLVACQKLTASRSNASSKSFSLLSVYCRSLSNLHKFVAAIWKNNHISFFILNFTCFTEKYMAKKKDASMHLMISLLAYHG